MELKKSTLQTQEIKILCKIIRQKDLLSALGEYYEFQPAKKERIQDLSDKIADLINEYLLNQEKQYKKEFLQAIE